MGNAKCKRWGRVQHAHMRWYHPGREGLGSGRVFASSPVIRCLTQGQLRVNMRMHIHSLLTLDARSALPSSTSCVHIISQAW